MNIDKMGRFIIAFTLGIMLFIVGLIMLALIAFSAESRECAAKGGEIGKTGSHWEYQPLYTTDADGTLVYRGQNAVQVDEYGCIPKEKAN